MDNPRNRQGAPGHPSPSKVRSAARQQPAQAPGASGLKQKIRAEAENQVLNAVSIAKEFIEDFTRTTRFFKVKVAIVGAWLFLSASTVFVACPTNPLLPNNRLGARLVVAGDASRPVYMVKNDSDRAWTDVMLIVNHDYRAASARVEPNGNLTLTAKQLVGPNGLLPPQDLRVLDLELHANQGKTVLFENGQPK